MYKSIILYSDYKGFSMITADQVGNEDETKEQGNDL